MNIDPAGYINDYGFSVIVIAGPTAVGKTEIGIELAELINGEIISADSRQFYKYMDVGTAKPTLRQVKRIPHHLIDIRLPDEPVSSGEFRHLALNTINEIKRRNRIPIVVGGSGLYIRALLQGIFPGSETNPAVRDKLQNEADEKGTVFLYNRLSEIDPVYAQKIHLNDRKRITRALEIFEITGQPPSEHFKKQKKEFPYRYTCFLVSMEREHLYQRINQRVDEMVKEGLLDEVQFLLSKGFRTAMNTLRTLGYQEAIEYLDGNISFEDMKNNLKRNTRRYAKRQLTWFRNQEDCVYIERYPEENPHSVARRILAVLQE